MLLSTLIANSASKQALITSKNVIVFPWLRVMGDRATLGLVQALAVASSIR